MRRLMTIWLVLAAAATLAIPAGATEDQETGHELLQDLAQVRSATATFHSIDNVIAAGHVLGWTGPALDHCIANEPIGAMGYHYFNHSRILDTELDPLRPEGIVYAPTGEGHVRLVAVEWIVPAELWHEAGNVGPPEVMGRELHILNPVLGWYILHAWVWMPNPSGMFED
jgi:hypothetical protein